MRDTKTIKDLKSYLYDVEDLTFEWCTFILFLLVENYQLNTSDSILKHKLERLTIILQNALDFHEVEDNYEKCAVIFEIFNHFKIIKKQIYEDRNFEVWQGDATFV